MVPTMSQFQFSHVLKMQFVYNSENIGGSMSPESPPTAFAILSAVIINWL